MLNRVRQLAQLLLLRLCTIVCMLSLVACVSHGPYPDEEPADPVARKNITIALLGGTGLAGSYILDRALAEGYDVKALARTPEKLARYEGRITIVQGDARDSDTIGTLLDGSDVVVSALGPVKADGEGANSINSSVTAELIRQMPQFDIQRYILVSGAAVVMPGDDRNFTGWVMRQLVSVGLNSELLDKQAEYELLANSDLDWTLVRCPLIEAEPFEGTPGVSLTTPSSFWLRAGGLAHFVVQQVGSEQYSREGPFLYNQ